MSKVLGIDVGGTGVKGAIVDTKRGILLTERFRFLTPPERDAKSILNTVLKIVDATNWDGKMIGCGFPAIMKNGVSHSASNIDKSFLGFDVGGYFSKKSNFKFNLINDADAAGLAEMKFGAGKDRMGTVVMLTLGTGIGSAIFHDGILLPNTELGHLKFKKTIAEKYTSNKAREKDKLTYDQFGKRLNEFLNHIDFILNPSLIVLGGGVSKKFMFYRDHIKLQKTEVVPALLKNEAGTIGAALSCELS